MSTGEGNTCQVLVLAEWVWCSFRPGETITEVDKVSEATKILRRCDKDDNGSVGREEFEEYYDKITADMFRCGERGGRER